MESEGLEDDRLRQNLSESRSRFQTYMQRLIAKYNQPFEDDPLVRMATLTYETPQGLRVWGGKLIKERNEEQTQGPSVTVTDRSNGQAPETDPESGGADTSSPEEDQRSCTFMPTVPGNPLETDLRRKYLTQVDILLQDAEYFKNAEKGDGKYTFMVGDSSMTSPVIPGPGCQDSISAKNFSGPEVSTSRSRDWGPPLDPCPADMTIVPRNDSFSLLETSSNSLNSSDICNATISDLYDGMMHSMSRLLSSKPSCVISTKTYTSQKWSLRRRLSHKGGMHRNRTYCHRTKPSQKSSQEEPGKEVRILRNCKNLLHVAPHKTALKRGRVSLEGSKLQAQTFSPAWKELQVMPQKSLDLNTMCHLERETRVKELQWLISPVKILPRPKLLPSQAEKQCREIELKFDKLHQECCLSSGKQLLLTGSTESRAINTYRGVFRNPGGPHGIKTHRPSLPFSREKAQKSSEGFEDLSEMSVKADRCLPRSSPSPSLSEDNPSQSPGHSQQMSGLFLQEYNPEPIRKIASPSTAISALWMDPPGSERNRYDEIKKEFDRLYQKYCLMSPQRVKVTSCVRISPMKAGAVLPGQTEGLKRLSPDSRFWSLRSSTSGWRIRTPKDSASPEAHTSTWTAGVVSDPQFPTKRCKLSYPPA